MHSEGDQPCVWMSAGLVRYKLCDGGFDCARCLFDAAMRGAAPEDVLRELEGGPLEPPAWHFPDDRRYAPSHVWILAVEDGALRLGVDAFAAALLGRVLRVTAEPCGRSVGPATPGCHLTTRFGTLPVRSPLAGWVARDNALLRRRPDRVVGAPYEDGWLLEIARDPVVREEGGGLMGAADIRARVELDLRRFRRRLGMELLGAAGQVGPTLADGGARLTDVSQMLGASRYLALVAEALG